MSVGMKMRYYYSGDDDDDDDDDLYSAIIHVSMLKAQVSVRKKGTHKKEDRQQHTKTK